MLDRNEDMRTTGTRHPYLGRYTVVTWPIIMFFTITFVLLYVKVGFTKDGYLLALDIKLYSNAGNSVDLSLPVK